jgi:hypothetical protein
MRRARGRLRRHAVTPPLRRTPGSFHADAPPIILRRFQCRFSKAAFRRADTPLPLCCCYAAIFLAFDRCRYAIRERTAQVIATRA